MNAKRAVAAIYDEDGRAVRRDGARTGSGLSVHGDDGARFSCQSREGVVSGTVVRSVAVGTKIEA